MKVVMTGLFPGKNGETIGGVAAASKALADSLSKIPDIDLRVVTCNPDVHRLESVDCGAYWVDYLPMDSRAGLFTQFIVNRVRLRRRIREIAPDVVHAQGAGFYALAAAETGLPTVLTVHGIFFEDSKYHTTGRLGDRIRSALYNRLNRRSLERPDHVIVISNYTWSAVGRFSRARTYRIDNPIHPLYFDHSWSPGSMDLLFVGVIYPYKGIEYLLSAFDMLKDKWPDLKLHLAGKVLNEAYYHELTDYVEAHGLGDRVTFLGPVGSEDLAKRYESAELMVLPSLQENAPIVIAEAMAVGCPVVATNVGGVAEMVVHGETGIVVEPREPEKLAAAIDTLMNDTELRRKMSGQAKELARDRFSSQCIADKTIEVYRSALGQMG